MRHVETEDNAFRGQVLFGGLVGIETSDAVAFPAATRVKPPGTVTIRRALKKYCYLHS
jgi:hypothetical protein